MNTNLHFQANDSVEKYASPEVDVFTLSGRLPLCVSGEVDNPVDQGDD